MKNLSFVSVLMVLIPLVAAPVLAEEITLPNLTMMNYSESTLKRQTIDEIKSLRETSIDAFNRAKSASFLLSGKTFDKPNVSVGLGHQSRIDDLLSIQKVYNLYVTEIQHAQTFLNNKNEVSIQVFFSDMSLTQQRQTCTVTPRLITLRHGALNHIPFSCDALSMPMLMSLSTDFTLRMYDQEISPINPLLDDVIHQRLSIDNNLLQLTGQVHIKVLSSGQ